MDEGDTDSVQITDTPDLPDTVVPSVASVAPGRPCSRLYEQRLLDIQKQKRKKAKRDAAEEEKNRIARIHFIEGLADLSYKVNEDVVCGFDVKAMGLGVPKLINPVIEEEDEETSDDETKENASSVHYSASSASMTSYTDASVGKLDIFHHRLIRFKAPDHIKTRITTDEGVPWLSERVNLSSLNVRYELPMDIRDLKDMDIHDYLSKYCKIPSERMLVYQKFFKLHKAPKTTKMTLKELIRAVHDAIYDTVSEEEVKRFLSHFQLHKHRDEIDLDKFAVIAATAERILYLSYAESAGRVHSGQVKPYVECADFSALQWKIAGLVLDGPLTRLLFSL